MRALVGVGLVLVACKSPPPADHVDAPGDCLQLPAASRSNLVADPMGGGLYWFEPVQARDYDGNVQGYQTLVRYDFATRRMETLADHVGLPLQILGDKIIVPRLVDKSTMLALVDRDHHVQSLLPDYLAPADVEPIDDHTIAVLANGDGPRAVYTLDLDRPRPHHLIDADILLSTWGGRVLVVVDQDLVSIEPNGRRKTLPPPGDTAHPQGQDAYTVVAAGIHVHRMVGNDDRTIVGDVRTWKLVNQAGSVLARTAPENGASHAYLLGANTAKPLATVTGGASIVGAAQLGAQTWALIGHNTVNYIGDLGETDGETEVCLLPPAPSTIAFKTRTFPKRYADKTELLRAAMPDAHGMQLLQESGSPPTLYIEVNERVGNDLAAARARARTAHDKVTSLLADRELRTNVHYADDRSGLMRWRRDRLRYRAYAGMGDAVISDAGDFDLEVKDFVNRRDVKGKVAKVLCSGTLTNVTAKPLEHVDVRCVAGDRVNVISIPSIAAGATAHFDRAFDANDGEEALFEVVSGREPLEVRFVENEARLLKVFELAAAVHDETELTLERHKPAAPMTVSVSAPPAFAQRSADELTAVAKVAYRRFLAIDQIYGLPPDPELTLTIAIEAGKSYKFDGTELTPVE